MTVYVTIASGLMVSGLLAAGAEAQTRSSSVGIDQISPAAAAAQPLTAPPAPAGSIGASQTAETSPQVSLNQLSGRRAPAAQAPQLSTAEAGRRAPGGPLTRDSRAPTPQLSRADATARAPSVPAAAIDACEAISAGRRAPIPGLDCEAVMEALAAAAPRPQPSAESELLADSRLESARREGALRGRNGSPDADSIARQLATGDVQNAPVAQAVGAGFNVPAPSSQRPPVVVTPGGPGAPPVVVDPGGR